MTESVNERIEKIYEELEELQKEFTDVDNKLHKLVMLDQDESTEFHLLGMQQEKIEDRIEELTIEVDDLEDDQPYDSYEENYFRSCED